MRALEQIADDILAVVKDPSEYVEELGVSVCDWSILRVALIKHIYNLGHGLPEWLVGWQGRSIRKIVRYVGLPSTAADVSPVIQVRRWLEFRGVSIPIPKLQPQQLYKDISELIQQFRDVGGGHGIIEIVIPSIKQLLRLMILYYLQDVQNHPDGLPEWSSLVKELEALDMSQLARLLCQFTNVRLTPYSTLSDTRISVVSEEEARTLNKLAVLAETIIRSDTNTAEAQDLLDCLRVLFISWQTRFKSNSRPVPKGAVVYSVTKDIHRSKLQCLDELQHSVTVKGVDDGFVINTQLLVDAGEENEHWGGALRPMPCTYAWITSSKLSVPNPGYHGNMDCSETFPQPSYCDSEEIKLTTTQRGQPANIDISIPTKRRSVFISYHHSEIELANRIRETLMANDVNVVIDVVNVKPGEHFDDFIANGIRETDVTLSIISSESLLSSWVVIETMLSFYQTERKDGKKYIAVYTDEKFRDSAFRKKATRKIDKKIAEIDKILRQHAELKIDTVDLDGEKTRLYKLRKNLGEVLERLRHSLALDVRQEKYEKSLSLIVKEIRAR